MALVLMEKLKNGALKLGLALTGEQLGQFDFYYREMMAWNARINLTAITGYEDVQVKHFLDSLTLLPVLGPRGKGLRVIDVGTGAGLPGLPLKIARPDIRLALLDATAKKATFLEKVVAGLGLDMVDIIVARAETAARESGYRQRFDMVLSRAIASLPALAELMLPFCAVGGICIAQKKGDIGEEVAGAAKAIEVLGGRLREVRAVDIEELGGGRWLVVIDKVKTTPPEYPRRPGMPVKRPIK